MSFLYDSHSSHLEFCNIVHMLPFLQDINVLLILFLHYREKMRGKESRRNEVACQLPNWGSPCAVGKRMQKSHLSPLPCKSTETGSLSLSGHRDVHHPELPAILLLVRLLRRHVWMAPPHPQQVALASEAQQLWCNDTWATVKHVMYLKAGQEKPGPGHLAIKGLVTFSLFTAYAAVVPLCSAMRDK